MPMHVKEHDVPGVQWDEEDLRDLRERLIAAGYKMPTESINRPRQAVKKRPWWMAFFVRLFRLNQ